MDKTRDGKVYRVHFFSSLWAISLVSKKVPTFFCRSCRWVGSVGTTFLSTCKGIFFPRCKSFYFCTSVFSFSPSNMVVGEITMIFRKRRRRTDVARSKKRHTWTVLRDISRMKYFSDVRKIFWKKKKREKKRCLCTGALRRYDRCVCKYIRIFIKLLKNALIRVGVQVWSTLLSRRRLVRPREVVSERERERQEK